MRRLRQLPESIRKLLRPKLTLYRWVSFKSGRKPRGRRLHKNLRKFMLETSAETDDEIREHTLRRAAVFDKKAGPLETKRPVGFVEWKKLQPRPEHYPPNEPSHALPEELQSVAPLSPSWDLPIEEPPVGNVRSSSSSRNASGDFENDSTKSSRSSGSSTRYMLASTGRRSTESSEGSQPRKIQRAGSSGASAASSSVIEQRCTPPLSQERQSTSIGQIRRSSSRRLLDTAFLEPDDHVHESQLRKRRRAGTPAEPRDGMVSPSTEDREPGVEVDHLSSIIDPSLEPPSESVCPRVPRKTTREEKSSTECSRSPSLSEEIETKGRFELALSKSSVGSNSEAENISGIPSPKSSPSPASKLSSPESPQLPESSSDISTTLAPAEGEASQVPKRRASTSSQSPSPKSRKVVAACSPENGSLKRSQSAGQGISGSQWVRLSKSDSPEIITRIRNDGTPSDRVSPPTPRDPSPTEGTGSQHGSLRCLRHSPTRTRASESEFSETLNDRPRGEAEEPFLRDSKERKEEPATSLRALSSGSDSSTFLDRDGDDQDPAPSMPCPPMSSKDSHPGAGVSEFVSPEIITHSRIAECQELSSHVPPVSFQDDSPRSCGSELLSPEIITHSRTEQRRGLPSNVPAVSSQDDAPRSYDPESFSLEIITHGQEDRHGDSSRNPHRRSSSEVSQESSHSRTRASRFVSPEIRTGDRVDRFQKTLGSVSPGHSQEATSKVPESEFQLRRGESNNPSEEGDSAADADVSSSSDGDFPLMVRSRFPKVGILRTTAELQDRNMSSTPSDDTSMASDGAGTFSPENDAVESTLRHFSQSPEHGRPRPSPVPSIASSSSDALLRLSESYEVPAEDLESLVERVFGDVGDRPQLIEDEISAPRPSGSIRTPRPRRAKEKTSALDELVAGAQASATDDLSSFWLELAREETKDP